MKSCCLLSFVTLVSGNSIIGDERTPVPNMRSCMDGYDPFEMDRFTKGKPDPGRKKRIFKPMERSREEDAVVLNDFVDYAYDINCHFRATTTVVNTMTEFLSTMSGSNIFDESKLDSSSQNVPLSPFVSYKNTKASRFSKGRESDYEKQEKYFENNNGEVYLNQAKCLVYRVSINKFAKAVFTEPFINALKQLQKAAKNPNRESSKRVRKDFIREYGTHFLTSASWGPQ